MENLYGSSFYTTCEIDLGAEKIAKSCVFLKYSLSDIALVT